MIQNMLIVLFDGIHHAMIDVILENYSAGIVESGANGRKLNQNLAAIAPLFYHPLNRFHMTDYTRHPVADSLRMLM